jgi:NAD+ kinase
MGDELPEQGAGPEQGTGPYGIILTMSDTLPTLRSIVVAAHPRIPEAISEAAAICAYFKEHKLESIHGTFDDTELRKRVRDSGFDLMVAVGGDGTMLRASHLCAPTGLPILGVNTGRLGFLIQVHGKEWQPSLELLLKGEYWIESRMMLRVEHTRSGESIGNWHALNEAVVTRGPAVRPIRIAASVDGHLLANYVADGLIAATSTGSTAYALAAGGPILPPELRNILLVPIAPHLSVDRAVVLSEGTSVDITLRGGDAVLSVDGQIPIGLAEGDVVDVRAGDYNARFVRFSDPGYFYRNLTGHMNQSSSIGIPR